MKKSAIARIVIWSVVALILTGLLISALVIPQKGFWTSLFNSSIFDSFRYETYTYDNENEYIAGSSVVISEQITNIDVDWISGSVKIIANDSDKIKFEESASDPIEEKYQLRYRVKGDTLYIKPCKSMRTLNKIPYKDLEIYIPYDLASAMHEIDIETASAEISLTEITAKELELSTASGGVWLEKCSAVDINLENVSGYINLTETNADKVDAEFVSSDIEIMGTVGRLRVKSVSGNVYLDSDTAPNSVDISTVSGNIKFEIPENDGFSIEFDSVSGKITSDFALTLNKGTQIYGNGSRDYEFETVSGDVSVKMK